MLTTVRIFPGSMLHAAGSASWPVVIVVVRAIGVPGAIIFSIAGVIGAGKLPSADGLHPVLKASAIVERVCNSVTQEAESYRSGIFEPFSQWPSVSNDALSKKAARRQLCSRRHLNVSAAMRRELDNGPWAFATV